jgi:hypothetical protein
MCFAVIWILVIPGAILTHMSVSKLIPRVKDLPDNIVKGFDEVFKFAYLAKDSADVKTAAEGAVQLCGIINAATTCSNPNVNPSSAAQQVTRNVASAKAAIAQAFATSLSVVSEIANDKYFGTADLKLTADNLNKITTELNKISDTMKCYEVIPTFCGIYVSADGITGGIATVNKAITSFKDNEMVEKFKDNTGLLTFLHALPYFMVLSLIFFAIFWWRGGVCCCCRGGTVCGTMALLPSILLWLVSFVIFIVVLAGGIGVKYAGNHIEIPVLNSKPTLDDAIDHIQNQYPAFWNLVFADFVDALELLLYASYFFVAASLLQALYTCCEFSCCPYRGKAEGGSPAAEPNAEPKAEPNADASKTIMQPGAEEKAQEPAAEQPVEVPVEDEGVHTTV